MEGCQINLSKSIPAGWVEESRADTEPYSRVKPRERESRINEWVSDEQHCLVRLSWADQFPDWPAAAAHPFCRECEITGPRTGTGQDSQCNGQTGEANLNETFQTEKLGSRSSKRDLGAMSIIVHWNRNKTIFHKLSFSRSRTYSTTTNKTKVR